MKMKSVLERPEVQEKIKGWAAELDEKLKADPDKPFQTKASIIAEEVTEFLDGLLTGLGYVPKEEQAEPSMDEKMKAGAEAYRKMTEPKETPKS